MTHNVPPPNSSPHDSSLKPAADLKSKGGLKRLWNAVRYSMQGFVAAWRHEAAFRQELLLVLFALPLGLYLGKNGLERALMVGSVLFILVVELLNSALESIVDKTSPEVHELAGRAKDMGSAAVFVALMTAAAVWGLVIFG